MDEIDEFLHAQRAARRRNKLAGLDGLILQLHDRGASFPEIAAFLLAHHRVSINPRNVSRRIAKLRRHGSATRSVSPDPGLDTPPAARPQTPARNAGDTLRMASSANAEGVPGDSEGKSGALTRDNSQAPVGAAVLSGGKPAGGAPAAVASASLSAEPAPNSSAPGPERDSPKGPESEPVFVRSGAPPQQQNTQAPPLPPGRERLGPAYNSRSPEAVAEQAAHDRRMRQNNRNLSSRSS
jgi:hypothetical protein